MPGRPPTVEHVKASFLAEIKAAENLISTIQAFSGGINPLGKDGIHPKHVRQVVELAFMAVVASWEEFLEMTLVRYMAGARTSNGYSPTPKFGRATSLEHAYRVLSGDSDFDTSKHYLTLSNPVSVTDSADFYFSKHGYSDVKAKAQLLRHALAIRNRVAHSSTKCRSDFKKTALEFLNPNSKKLKQGYGPGDLLLEEVTRHFGQHMIGKTHFEAYMDLYKMLSNKIVP